ncbi:hypothetical protein Q8G71_34810, partial [Klebsiella pneumoniae]
EAPALKKAGTRPEEVFVTLEVAKTNSKVFYVISSTPNGDQVARLPCNGGCVADVLGDKQWTPIVAAAAEIVLLRRGTSGAPWQELPVDW